MADKIPDLGKPHYTPKPQQQSERTAPEQPEALSPPREDSVSVASVNKWVDKLKAMPDPELDPALLKEIEEALPEKLEGQLFDDEVFPTIANELARDWGLSET